MIELFDEKTRHLSADRVNRFIGFPHHGVAFRYEIENQLKVLTLRHLIHSLAHRDTVFPSNPELGESEGR